MFFEVCKKCDYEALRMPVYAIPQTRNRLNLTKKAVVVKTLVALLILCAIVGCASPPAKRTFGFYPLGTEFCPVHKTSLKEITLFAFTEDGCVPTDSMYCDSCAKSGR